MLQSLGRKVRALAGDEVGLSTVEYVVLLVLIVAMAVAAWNTFGTRVQGKLGTASDSFDSTVKAGAGKGDAPTVTDEQSVPGRPRTIVAE